MSRQMGLLHKGLRAQQTAVGPLARVNPQMILQQLITREGALAQGTAVDPLAGVQAQVAGQLCAAGKSALAHLARVHGAVHTSFVVL